ncbi:hypothetical protein PILCRDRAFT_8548 [Piloderma croceum F 1598]|uniref:Uncharacterized protein n=1 Tax=Piloderma croceum (strain F 1598) TaxID=765440 RepID=A0A0C3BWZ7_PILCF|nr:hypothetical protein PILCRDRAFT_8548 [Piloderma croceum F 1598]
MQGGKSTTAREPEFQMVNKIRTPEYLFRGSILATPKFGGRVHGAINPNLASAPPAGGAKMQKNST